MGWGQEPLGNTLRRPQAHLTISAALSSVGPHSTDRDMKGNQKQCACASVSHWHQATSSVLRDALQPGGLSQAAPCLELTASCGVRVEVPESWLLGQFQEAAPTVCHLNTGSR